MFGPFDPLLGSHIQSITDALDIPHLEARLDIEPQEKEFSINLFPSHTYLNQAYKDMIQFLKWKKVAIIYEEDFGKGGGILWRMNVEGDDEGERERERERERGRERENEEPHQMTRSN